MTIKRKKKKIKYCLGAANLRLKSTSLLFTLLNNSDWQNTQTLDKYSAPKYSSNCYCQIPLTEYFKILHFGHRTLN